MSSVVRIERVSKEYLLGEQTVQALNDITLAIEPGVFLAISGPSGSGKTTLLNLIGCIDQPSSGDIYINEQNVSQKSANELADLRARSIGFIFQTFNLLPVLSAAENVEYPLLRRKDLSTAERKQCVSYFLDIVGLDKYANNRPNQLSGGQRQRVAIARALAIKPAIVLADEPTANLDKATGIEILGLMKQINEHLGTTFIFSTHDQKVIDHANRLVEIEDGGIMAFGIRNQKGNWHIARVAPHAASATGQNAQ
ncbi:MAG: ABC transporter ATP-binding protein [Azonexus sp.]|jgi:putative ABC transport system ATP-binding protein|uniref:ABC transporter ATP-binding protein n=1 Tax=Azonexus sp. TaxID=1872668 RepID=UPI00282A2A31|nr:ABC transporter ATP-binding protein [Azonexus sp.]MDR0775265.1 ABC transporter ATP-binding protein [Azonexus sp.]